MEFRRIDGRNLGSYKYVTNLSKSTQCEKKFCSWVVQLNHFSKRSKTTIYLTTRNNVSLTIVISILMFCCSQRDKSLIMTNQLYYVPKIQPSKNFVIDCIKDYQPNFHMLGFVRHTYNIYIIQLYYSSRLSQIFMLNLFFLPINTTCVNRGTQRKASLWICQSVAPNCFARSMAVDSVIRAMIRLPSLVSRMHRRAYQSVSHRARCNPTQSNYSR